MNASMLSSTPFDRFLAAAEERVHLHAGAQYVSEMPALIHTMLSSSVAVCLWSPLAAGMAHYVLPRGGSDRSMRCGNYALATLLDRILVSGAALVEIVAGIFGGAEHSPLDGGLGRRNIASAHEFLAKHDIPIIREDVGGHVARRVSFRTIDGSTIVRTLTPIASRDLRTVHDKS